MPLAAGRKPASVAQTSKSAVSPISKSARRAKSSPEQAWKPAAQQTWKSALRLKPSIKADLRLWRLAGLSRVPAAMCVVWFRNGGRLRRRLDYAEELLHGAHRRRQVAHRAGVCRGNDVGAYIRPSVAQSADFLDLIAPAGLGVKDDLRGRVDLDVVGAAAQEPPLA